MSADEIRSARLAKVAALYYVEGFNQQEIAESTGIARSMISRMLSEAKERDIVRFQVSYPWRSKVLEADMRARFGLQDARIMVADGESYGELQHLLGQLALPILTKHLHPNAQISLSWGTSIHAMIEALPPIELPEAEVFQIIGATGTERHPSDGPALARMLSDRLSCHLRPLHAPLLVESPTVRNALVQDRGNAAVLEGAANSQIAFIGIGTLNHEANSLLRTGYLSDAEVDSLTEAGAVGDICAIHFDADGKILDTDINRRIVGIDPTNLKRIKTVVGIAGGEIKRAAILGALCGEYIDALVTDSETAEWVLSNAER